MKTVLFEINTNIDLSSLSSRILRNEKKILKNYPPTDYCKRITDGKTGLGTNSLTSRFYHFNVLSWFGTRKLKKYIKKGYEQYNNVKNAPIYVQCWANVMRKGDMIKAHTHASLGLSPLHSLSGHLCVKVDGSTNTYYKGTPIQNKNGQMILFPSTISHWTDRYMGDDERITIAFDIISKELFDYDIFEDAKKHWIRL
tara:strand:- start:57 stop:650 length:594 start_codon:yes stop_codon:yes gene_type:complete